jgi:ribosome-binding factor A
MPKERGPQPPRKRRPKGALPSLGEPSPASDRGTRVASEIRRALQVVLQRGVNDPRVQGMVSVTDVELSGDGSFARVRVSVLPEDRAPLSVSGLRAAAAFLRRMVMDETRIPRVPRLEFELDERLKRQARLDEALRTAPKDHAMNSEKENSENQRDEG